jgi:hypothetical protein
MAISRLTPEQLQARQEMRQAQLDKLASLPIERQTAIREKAEEIFAAWSDEGDGDYDVWELATELASLVLGRAVPVS